MVYRLNVLVCVSYNVSNCKIHININHKQNDPEQSIQFIYCNWKFVIENLLTFESIGLLAISSKILIAVELL